MLQRVVATAFQQSRGFGLLDASVTADGRGKNSWHLQEDVTADLNPSILFYLQQSMKQMNKLRREFLSKDLYREEWEEESSWDGVCFKGGSH